MDAGISGRELAKTVYRFVRDRYPNRRFNYETAREELEATGVVLRGTGSTMRAALSGAPDLFLHADGPLDGGSGRESSMSAWMGRATSERVSVAYAIADYACQCMPM